MTDRSAPRSIVAVGALPPPVNGMALVTSRMVERLRATEIAPQVFDISPRTQRRGPRYHATKLTSVLHALLALSRGTTPGQRRLYMPVDAGWGMAYTAAVVGRARSLDYRIWVHHHNYSYVARRERRMAALLRTAGPQATHVLLCERMEREFRATYRGIGFTRVVGNAGFVEEVNAVDSSRRRGLRLGLLGNLDERKGLDLALDCFELLAREANDIELLLGGPLLRRSDRHRVESTKSIHGPRIDLRGPLDTEGKRRFWSDVDVLLFPSRLREGQPLVVLEALAAGVPVLAYGEGCVPGLLDEGCGLAIECGRPFVAEAAPRLREWIADPSRRIEAGRRAVRRFRQLRDRSEQAIDALVASMVG